MATLKHLSSKNADYGAAEQYLTFEHDEFTGRPVLDENGRLVPRQDYRISSLNCGGEDFAVACMRANLRYGKNQRREDVKSHHYILSFDPRDGPDHGLTMDKAQALGERFCAEQFPGHQALVCTHPDGHNHSGNIHVHIVINSLRVAEAERKPYMDRASDTQAGAKHRCTAAAMRHFRAEVMELCQGAGLYQIDLLGGSKNRVTEREYWAQKKGQLALDTEAAAQGKPPTKFETDKEKLRREIRAVLAVAVSFEDFAQRLLQRGITVKESRGRLSYLTPDRTKPITARKLGDDFDRAAVGAALERNAARPSLGAKPSIREQLRQPQGVQRMVDIEAKKAEGKGIGYQRWASNFNLKQNYLNDPRPENMPILEDLYDLLRAQDEKEAQYIATALEIYVTGSLNVFNHRSNVNVHNRIVCYDIKELGKQLKKIGMLVVQDQVWNRVTINRAAHKSTRYYIDEMHLLLKEEQTAAYTVEIWKRFRKWGGIPTGK